MKIRSAHFWANAAFVLSLALLIAAAGWYVAADDLPSDQISRSGNGSAPVRLTQADWQIVEAPGLSTPPPTVDSRVLPDTWQQIVLPRTLPAASPARNTPTQAAGASLPVDDVDSDIRVAWIKLSTTGLHLPAGPLALYGVRIKTEGTVALYIDGRLVQRVQQQGPLWNSLFTPLWVTLDQNSNDAPPQEILFRIEYPASTRVSLSSLWLGPLNALRARYYTRQWLQRELPATLSAAFLAVGIFSLFVWLKRRHESDYLLFFNLAAVSFVGHLHYYVNLPILDDWFAWLTSNALFWLVTVIHLFLCKLHGRKQPWLTVVVVVLTGAISVLTLVGVLPQYPNPSPIVHVVYAIAVLLGAAVGVAGIVNSWGRSREGVLIAASVSAGTLLGMSDWLLYANITGPEGWFLGAYTNAVTFAAFGLLIYRRYITAIGEVERSNANLAQRLQEREAELDLSHQKLREAALRQTISDERQRLMQDMHDGLGSSLISAIRSVEQGGVSDQKVSQILKDCLDDLKLTIDSMEPVEADLLLLLATLRFRLEPRLEGTGIALLWEVRELPALAWLEPSSALHILRIVQESIANILRHTRADKIRVATEHDGDGVSVIIEDNGQGFDVEKALASAAGRGLHNQRRRAQSVDGMVTWESGAEGTRFVLWLPLVRKAANPAL